MYINQPTEIHFYVNMPGHSPCYSTVSEALEALSHQAPCAVHTTPDNTAFQPSKDTPTNQVYPAPHSDIPPAIIHIGKGIYRERLVISRPNVALQGEGKSPQDVILVYGDGAFHLMPEGDKRGTFRTATVRIDAQDFTARNLTFQNDAGPGYTAGQALALYVDGDRAYFEDCILLGHQDTLFTAPLPEQEFQPGGFKGPGEFKPRTMTRQCYRNCYIEGDVDFIFGSAICYFEGCTLFSKAREDLKDKTTESDETPIHGYITAASTPQSASYGYVFKDCKLESDCPKASVYLGRPWREFAKTVFLNCRLGEHIHPLGWNDWKKTHGNFFYAEYKSYGPGASPDTRADYSHQLTEAEVSCYTAEAVLNGWKPV